MGALTHYFAFRKNNFVENCMKVKEFAPRHWRGLLPLPPPPIPPIRVRKCRNLCEEQYKTLKLSNSQFHLLYPDLADLVQGWDMKTASYGTIWIMAYYWIPHRMTPMLLMEMSSWGKENIKHGKLFWFAFSWVCYYLFEPPYSPNLLIIICDAKNIFPDPRILVEEILRAYRGHTRFN